jgi:DNA-nicking Smr family endonuclease
MTKRPSAQMPPDFALWDEVKTSIRPLGPSRKKKTTRASTKAHAAPAPAIIHARLQPMAEIMHTPAAKHVVPPLSTFERRTAQKLGRGKMEPDATIDLHGHGLEESYIRLLRFIEGQRLQGSRLLLVITGKGASPFGRHTLHGHTHYASPEREGRIRREVPIWLEETRFRQHVVGYQPAHPRHGGGGAFYVRLRRA